MNISFFRGLRAVRFLALLLLALVLLLLAPAVKAQSYTNVYGPNFYQAITNFPMTLTNGQTVTLVGQRFPMSVRGFGLAAKVHGTNNCTGNVAFGCEFSIDGTTNTQTTTTPTTLLVPLANTATKVNGTNVPPSSSSPGANWRDATVVSVVNPHTNSIVVDAAWFTENNQ